MLVKIIDLKTLKSEKKYDIDILEISVSNNPYLNKLKDNKGYISFYYDISDKLHISYDLKGKMVCPSPMTLKDVEIEYNLEEDDYVCFDEFDEGFFISSDMDIVELLLNIILPEVPIKVENNDKTMYDYGDGLKVMSEDMYAQEKKDKIDPRLEILKNYKGDK